MRPIDADVALEKIENAYSFSDNRGKLAYAISCVKDAPTLEVAKMLDEESLKAAHEACERDAECGNPDACTVANYERKERRFWQARCHELEKKIDEYAPVIHAHWIEESSEYYKAWQEAFGTENFFRDCEYFTEHIACSNCLKLYNIMDNDSAGCWKFCPNCGAKME